MTQKSLIKMQISPIKNPNFEKPFRNLSNRTKVKILRKNFFGYLSKKIWFRACSITAEMFEHRNSGENRRKRSEFFSKIYEGHIRIWFRPKKNSKLSHACVPLNIGTWDQLKRSNYSTYRTVANIIVENAIIRKNLKVKKKFKKEGFYNITMTI